MNSSRSLAQLSYDVQPFYCHKKLEDLRTSFRLLELCSVEDTPEILRGVLNQFRRDDNPKYIALSYEWGSPFAGHTIMLDGIRFSIRTNLFNILQQYAHNLRDNDQERSYIFIDAICIDQSNIEERNAQVAMMATTFWAANEVSVWLSGAISDAEACFNMFNDLDGPSLEPLRHRKIAGQSEFICKAAQRRISVPLHPFFTKIRELPTGESICVSRSANGRDIWGLRCCSGLYFRCFKCALIEFCECTYFTRAWIVQEILVGRRVTVNHGRFTTSVDRLSYAVDIASSVTCAAIQESHQNLSNYYTLARILHMRKAFHPISSPVKLHEVDFFKVMAILTRQQCADIRDRVFSLIGITLNGDRCPADYGLSTLAVFMRACQIVWSFHDVWPFVALAELRPTATALGLNAAIRASEIRLELSNVGILDTNLSIYCVNLHAIGPPHNDGTSPAALRGGGTMPVRHPAVPLIKGDLYLSLFDLGIAEQEVGLTFRLAFSAGRDEKWTALGLAFLASDGARSGEWLNSVSARVATILARGVCFFSPELHEKFCLELSLPVAAFMELFFYLLYLWPPDNQKRLSELRMLPVDSRNCERGTMSR